MGGVFTWEVCSRERHILYPVRDVKIYTHSHDYRSRTVAVIETTVTSSVASLRISATGDKPCHLGNKQYDW